jgi:hypothetical protein
MNIFVLDRNAITAAEQHCDKHVRKMVIESAQMLTTAYYFGAGIKSNKAADARRSDIHDIFGGFPRVDDQGKPLPYRISHPGHPCTVWTSKSFNNFAWHLLLASALSEEFQRRWGKEHAVKPILGWMAKHPPPSSYAFDESFNLTPFAQAMPECFRGPDPVEAYRRLYHHKASLFDVTWKAPSTAPDWFSFGGVHSAKATFALSNRVDP